MSTTARDARGAEGGSATGAGTGSAERPAPSITMRPLRLLEVVAERGGATAHELRDGLGCSLPTVYRLAQSLVDAGYLVHIASESRFELGYALNPLGVALHQQVGTSPAMRRIVDGLHRAGEVAAYYAVYRGADAVVAYVSDDPDHPRIAPLRFGFHEAIHATAFGKIILAGMSIEERDQILAHRGMAELTPHTITSRDDLEAQLARVATERIAWEHGEFVMGQTCAAAAVRDAQGKVVGAIAISMHSHRLPGRERAVVPLVHEAAHRASALVRERGAVTPSAP